MAEQEVKLMKGNEALAHAAIRCGADGYFGYPACRTETVGNHWYGGVAGRE